MLDWGVLALALVGGVLRISPALVWAAVGDCLTQRCGHFNLGLEGIVACGAVVAVLVAGISGQPWLGVVAAAAAGSALAVVFCLCCMLPGVNQLAVGIALLIAGVALARFVGEGLAAAPTVLLPVFKLAGDRQAVLQFSALLPLGVGLAVGFAWALRTTRLGLLITAAGSAGADGGMRVVGLRPWLVRTAATAVGGACGGVGGACLGLFYPGGWSDQLATGIGIMALTLAFLARARPMLALLAALAFAALAALGPALQVVLGTGNYHLLNSLPYVVALVVLVLVSRHRGWSLA